MLKARSKTANAKAVIRCLCGNGRLSRKSDIAALLSVLHRRKSAVSPFLAMLR